MNKMERRNEHNEYIREEREEREKIWKMSRDMLQMHAIGFIQQAVREGGNGRFFKLELDDNGSPVLKDRGEPRRFDVPKQGEFGDFVLVNPRKEEPSSYFMRLRMLDDPEYPHSLLQIVRCDTPEILADPNDWNEMLTGVETPSDYEDSFYNLISMADRMGRRGLVTASVEMLEVGCEIFFSLRNEDQIIKDFCDWVDSD